MVIIKKKLFVFCLLSFYLYGKLRATRPKHKNIQFTSPITYGEHPRRLAIRLTFFPFCFGLSRYTRKKNNA